MKRQIITDTRKINCHLKMLAKRAGSSESVFLEELHGSGGEESSLSRVWVGEQSGEEREERTPDRNS